jgi:hypothetical protein
MRTLHLAVCYTKGLTHGLRDSRAERWRQLFYNLSQVALPGFLALALLAYLVDR